MKPAEKIVWLQVLLSIWGLFLFALLAVAWSPGPEFLAGLRVGTMISAAFTAVYLLILSWRVAYLSGRKRR